LLRVAGAERWPNISAQRPYLILHLYKELIHARSTRFHAQLGARFLNVNGLETVEHYGDVADEYRALRETAGIFDLSFRSRICLLGVDRQKFLNGQVTTTSRI